jgi:hypothetical protein
MRVADVLPIENSGISSDLYRFALQAHFDFLVTDNDHSPLFAVEFDGPRHRTRDQINRDERKNTLCEQFQLPLLRINARHLNTKYRTFDLLSWFVEVWFARDAFFKAQDAGIVPWDEMFDPMSIIGLPGYQQTFPLCLSINLSLKIQNLAKSNTIIDPWPTEWIGVDDRRNYRGIIWLWIDDENGVVAQTAMRAQLFPIVESQLLRELLVFELYEELSQVLSGRRKATPITKINETVKQYTKKYKFRVAGGSHLPPGNPFKST